VTLPQRGSDPGAAGFVLAGGQSSRMGTDKALVEFSGEPLVGHALRILREAGIETSIAGARSPLGDLAPVVDDHASFPGQGPLSGICGALAATRAQHAVFIPVDLPFLPPSLIAYMLGHARITGAVVTCPAIKGYTQTFPAVIDQAILPDLLGSLNSGDRGTFAAFRSAAGANDRSMSILPVEYLVQAGQVLHPAGIPPSFWFLNFNMPHDIDRAEGLLRSHGQVS
jgi:molybdopterin-guanine dinucleotide biosynthesis protein A